MSQAVNRKVLELVLPNCKQDHSKRIHKKHKKSTITVICLLKQKKNKKVRRLRKIKFFG